LVLRGLAEGLQSLHDVNCRHGDLKPANILVFKDNEEGEDNTTLTFKIADLGVSTFHQHNSQSRVGSNMIGGTARYEPPERCLRKNISAAYDMWSLGCVYLEFVIWLVKGSQDVEKLSTLGSSVDRRDERETDGFFEILPADSGGPERARVKPSLLLWMEHLAADERGSNFIRDFLKFIETRLLVIESAKRATSRQVVEFFEEALERGKNDSNYLVGGPKPYRATISRPKKRPPDNSLITMNLFQPSPKIPRRTSYTTPLWYSLRVPSLFVKRVPRNSKVVWYPLKVLIKLVRNFIYGIS
jgi:serine/threonine protein kinase